MIWFFPLPVQASDCAYLNQISNNKNFIFGYSFLIAYIRPENSMDASLSLSLKRWANFFMA